MGEVVVVDQGDEHDQVDEAEHAAAVSEGAAAVHQDNAAAAAAEAELAADVAASAAGVVTSAGESAQEAAAVAVEAAQTATGAAAQIADALNQHTAAISSLVEQLQAQQPAKETPPPGDAPKRRSDRSPASGPKGLRRLGAAYYGKRGT